MPQILNRLTKFVELTECFQSILRKPFLIQRTFEIIGCYFNLLAKFLSSLDNTF